MVVCLPICVSCIKIKYSNIQYYSVDKKDEEHKNIEKNK